MEGLPSHVTPIAWRQVRYNETFVNFFGEIDRWRSKLNSDAKYLILDVKPRRVLVVPEHDLPQQFDSLVVGYWTKGQGVIGRAQFWVPVPYTIEERRD